MRYENASDVSSVRNRSIIGRKRTLRVGLSFPLASHRAKAYLISVTKADRPDQPNAAARFNEEAATYAVQGSEAPDLAAGVAAIRNVLKTLPARPGVYRIGTARDRRAGVFSKIHGA